MNIYKLVFSPIEVNTYIIADDSGNCSVIDCGCYDESEFSELVNFLESKKLNPVMLLNTHCHLDHIFGNKRFFEKYGLLPRYSELEESNRKNAPNHAMLFGLTMKESPKSKYYISHGDEISFDSVKLKALHVPGHTAGMLAFYSYDGGCVFTGDTLFAGSIGRTDLPGGDLQTLINSIKNNLLTLPPDTIVYSGHGQETTIGKESLENPYLG